MNSVIELPGDKSISHRVAMIAAIADGPCRIHNYNAGADCAATLRCLRMLGADINGNLKIEPAPLRRPDQPLDCGNSGSTIRMLTGLLAGQNVPAVLTGDESLRKRPMSRVAGPLRKMGAVIDLHEESYAPVVLREGAKHAIEYQMPVSSAQVKSAILFAGLRFPGTAVLERIPSRDHTERLFQHLQIDTGKAITQIPSFDYTVPGDPSSAAFFVLAALLREGSEVLLPNVLINPFRAYYLQKLQESGARIAVENQRMMQREPVADLRILGGGSLRAIQITPEEVPALIDEIPALSLIGTLCGMEVRGAEELRFKESDRIHAVVSNLQNLGIHVEEWNDGYRVYPGKLRHGEARCYGDHRVAMAFAAAGAEVDEPDCAGISFPEFFPLLRSLQ